MNDDQCNVKRCSRIGTMYYAAGPKKAKWLICPRCWGRHADSGHAFLKDDNNLKRKG